MHWKLLAVVVAFVPRALQASSVAVLPVEATNLTAGEAASVGELFADAYAMESGRHVLSPSDIAHRAGEGEALQDVANRLGATELIAVKVMRLERSLKVQARKLDSAGREIFTVRATAASLDDLELVAVRVAEALIDEVPLEQTRKLGRITKKEAKSPHRVASRQRMLGIKTGVRMPLAQGYQFAPMASLQFNALLESDSGIYLQTGAGFLVGTSSNDNRDSYGGLIAEIGGGYVFGNASVAPYVGIGVEPRLIMTSQFFGANLTGYGQLGLMFMREHRMGAFVELRVAQNVLPLETSPWRHMDDKVWPTEVGLNVGIGW